MAASPLSPRFSLVSFIVCPRTPPLSYFLYFIRTPPEAASFSAPPPSVIAYECPVPSSVFWDVITACSLLFAWSNRLFSFRSQTNRGFQSREGSRFIPSWWACGERSMRERLPLAPFSLSLTGSSSERSIPLSVERRRSTLNYYTGARFPAETCSVGARKL